MTAWQETAGAEGKRTHEQSTIAFPYGDLDDAVAIAQAINKNAGAACTTAQLAAYTGSKSVDGGLFRLKLATTRVFGLVEVERGMVSLTPLGREIVDPAQEQAARAKAFLTVPLYGAIFKRYEGYVLPKDIGLENDFVGLGVAFKQRGRARQAFQRSAGQAGFFAHGRERLVMPTGVPSTRPADGSPIDKPGPQDRLPNAHQEHSTNSSGSGGGGRKLPTLILGLVEKLPREGDVWSETEQDQWLAVAKGIFGLVYQTQRQALSPGQPSDETSRQ